jgi:hypothetical protein
MYEIQSFPFWGLSRTFQANHLQNNKKFLMQYASMIMRELIGQAVKHASSWKQL